jgi:3-phosphoshikimate 1-carboxyvinyltransferase
MAAPMLNKDIEIIVDGDLISKPYIDITLSLLKMFNVTYTNNNYRSFKYFFSKENTYSYNKKYINVEPDASSASYFFAAAAISGSIEVKGLNQASIQGDIKFLDFIKKMGAQVQYLDNSIKVSMASELLGGEFDCIAIPDAAMTIAVMALFAKSPVKLINIKSWKVKETDRIIAMKNELEKFGAFVSTTENTIEINPPQKIKNNVKVETYNDHRMAMCFSLTCLAGVTTIIHDPECVKKTYPNYFKDFLSLVK